MHQTAYRHRQARQDRLGHRYRNGADTYAYLLPPDRCCPTCLLLIRMVNLWCNQDAGLREYQRAYPHSRLQGRGARSRLSGRQSHAVLTACRERLTLC